MTDMTTRESDELSKLIPHRITEALTPLNPPSGMLYTHVSTNLIKLTFVVFSSVLQSVFRAPWHVETLQT